MINREEFNNVLYDLTIWPIFVHHFTRILILNYNTRGCTQAFAKTNGTAEEEEDSETSSSVKDGGTAAPVKRQCWTAQKVRIGLSQ